MSGLGQENDAANGRSVKDRESSDLSHETVSRRVLAAIPVVYGLLYVLCSTPGRFWLVAGRDRRRPPSALMPPHMAKMTLLPARGREGLGPHRLVSCEVLGRCFTAASSSPSIIVLPIRSLDVRLCPHIKIQSSLQAIVHC